MKVLVPHERRTLWLAESQGDRISFVWTWHAALAHVLFGFEQKFSFACKFVTAADQISLQRIAVRQTEAARLQGVFEVAPHFSAAIGWTSSGIAFFIKRRGLYRFTAEIDSIDNAAIGTGLIKTVIDPDSKAANIDVHFCGLFFSNNFLHPIPAHSGIRVLFLMHREISDDFFVATPKSLFEGSARRWVS